MPFLQLRDSRYPLRPGANRVGWGPEVEVRLPASPQGVTESAAVVMVEGTGSASVAPGPEPTVVVLNGVPVAGPSPVLHGDRLGVGEFELRFGDEAQLGETVEFPVDPDLAIAVPGPAARSARSEGRLLSLVDGREYLVGVEGLSIGRDPSCDIVIPRADVSRRHATLRAEGGGYLLLDTSVNGVFVNQARVQAELPLGRGDMLRVATEEYRFYAEERSAPVEAESIPGLLNTGAFVAARRPTPAEGPAAVLPAAALTSRPSFGHFEVINEGPSKGTRYDLDSPRVTIGRGAHNDVSINDESVSEYHAKLQRRENAWYVLDLESTNGTYVGGQRVSDEVKLTSGEDVRFGGVKMTFHGSGSVARSSGETRVIVGVKSADPKRAEPRHKELNDRVAPEAVEQGAGISPILWLIVIVLVILAVLAVVRGGGQ
ncbi:MAG: FHA domain-containing protein [Cytophagaceae bacterium]|nr:FHA domain-containing protein [Gemmatimonadaceae bacterium]